MEFFFLTVHVIQKLVNWSDKKVMLVPSKSLNQDNQDKSSKTDVSSVFPASDQTSKTPNAVPDVIDLSGGNEKKKRKSRWEVSEDKALVS